MKRKNINFFHVVTGSGQDLTNLTDKENTQQLNFFVGQAKNLNCILFSHGADIRCHLTWLKY